MADIAEKQRVHPTGDGQTRACQSEFGAEQGVRCVLARPNSLAASAWQSAMSSSSPGASGCRGANSCHGQGRSQLRAICAADRSPTPGVGGALMHRREASTGEMSIAVVRRPRNLRGEGLASAVKTISAMSATRPPGQALRRGVRCIERGKRAGLCYSRVGSTDQDDGSGEWTAGRWPLRRLFGIVACSC